MSTFDPESVLSSVKAAPADPILGLNEEVAAAEKAGRDPVNLGVGVYRDEAGKVPVFKIVRELEQNLKREGKGYLPITGLAEFNLAAQELLFLGASDALKKLRDAKRIVSAQVLGGTGGVSLAQALLRLWFKKSLVLVSDPTWAPHATILRHQMPDGEILGFQVENYPYWDAATRKVKFAEMCAKLKSAPACSIIVLHGCCQNPTGMDLTPEQSKQVLEICKECGHIPVIDLAYQGFGEGLEQDNYMVRQAAELIPFFLVLQSFSKTMSFYDERVGVFHLITSGKSISLADGKSLCVTELIEGWMKTQIRRLWSNPPRPSARLAYEILSNPKNFASWHAEINEMRETVIKKRKALADAFRQHDLDFQFMCDQKGIFSFTGLPSTAVNILKEKHAIFMPQDGRMNVAAVTFGNLNRVVEGVSSTIRELGLRY